MSTLKSSRQAAPLAVRPIRRTQNQTLTSYREGSAKSKAPGHFWARFHVFEGRIVDLDAPIVADGWEVRDV